MAAEGQTGSKMLDEMLEYRIFELLKKYHYTLTTAESATGGMIASTLINVPGISAFFTEGYDHLFKRSEGEDDPCEAGDD